MIPTRVSHRLLALSVFVKVAFHCLCATAQAQSDHDLSALQVEGRPYGEELVGPYGQPRWSARGRFSADTDVYVLPPFSFYLDTDYHGTFPQRGKADHLFTEEFELGLPYRFQVAFEFYQEYQDGRGQIPFALVEGRYALADWGKIPLNPTLLAEYSWGIGREYAVQPGQNREIDRPGEEEENDNAGEGTAGAVRKQTSNVSDAYEVRLLLGQEIGKSIEFAANVFYDQDLGGARERELGFSTATSCAVRGEAWKVGLETSYRNVSERGNRSHAQNIFEVGPSFTWKPSPHTRLDVAPLLGTTYDSPRLEVFCIFSIDFGTGASAEVEGPAVRGGRR